MLLTYAWLLEDIHSLYYNHQLKAERKLNRYIICNYRFCKLLSNVFAMSKRIRLPLQELRDKTRTNL
jgi:hypothetical protein